MYEEFVTGPEGRLALAPRYKLVFEDNKYKYMIEKRIVCDKCERCVSYGHVSSYNLESVPGVTLRGINDSKGFWTYANGLHYCGSCSDEEYPILKETKFEDLKLKLKIRF